MNVCVCVCVCVREREREHLVKGNKKRIFLNFMSDNHIIHYSSTLNLISYRISC